jgi:SlyX protein
MAGTSASEDLSMNPAPIEQRLVDIETRLAFQEQALAEMSDALAAARAESARNSELLQRALDDLRQLRTLLYADPASEPPPPHW